MISLQHLKSCPSILKQPLVGEEKMAFCSDTRKYKHPSAFVAIPGVKVNPLDVLGSLLDQKCPYVFYQSDSTNQTKVVELRKSWPQTNFIPVTDSITFLQ